MLNDIEKVAEMLRSGKEPGVDDLGRALAAAIGERDACERMLRDMAGWMSTLVAAYLRNDAAAMAATFSAFMEKHVKVVHQTDGRTH